MILHEFKNGLLDSLKPFAERNGFKIDKERFALFFENRDLISTIDFIYEISGPEVDIYPYVNIEYKTVHAICERCGFHLNYTAYINLFVLEAIQKFGWENCRKYQSKYQRIGAHNVITDKMEFAAADRLALTEDKKRYEYHCERYPFAKDKSFLVSEDGWLEHAVKRIEVMLPYAVDYIKKFNTIEAIDKLYNSLPIERNPNCSGIFTHCVIGIISAKLAHNPQYDKVKEAYLSILTDLGPLRELKPVFLRIVDYLDNSDM